VDALAGDDTVTVSASVLKTVWVDAGDGNDTVTIQPYSGPDRRDVILGGKDNDKLLGSSGSEWIFGGPGNDWLSGGPDRGTRDRLFGEGDNDPFQLIPDKVAGGATPLAEFMDGGEGDDRVLYAGGDLDNGAGVPDYVAIRYNTLFAQYELTSLVVD